MGVGNQPDAPGRFGGGVAVTGSEGCVMYPGLDNYDPRRGTVEFWAQSRGDVPIWADGKEHWLLVLYPERAGASPRYGMSPTFVTLRKTAENALELRIVNTSAPSYAAAPSLRAGQGPSLAVTADKLAAESWHHVLCSWDLAGTGRMWLLVDGQGVTADLGLPKNHPAPNPGGLIVFGGLWGLPGDGVETSNCNLDDLRIQTCTVEPRLEGHASDADCAARRRPADDRGGSGTRDAGPAAETSVPRRLGSRLPLAHLHAVGMEPGGTRCRHVVRAFGRGSPGAAARLDDLGRRSLSRRRH